MDKGFEGKEFQIERTKTPPEASVRYVALRCGMRVCY